MIEDIIFI